MNVTDFSIGDAFAGNNPIQIAMCQLTLQNVPANKRKVYINFYSSSYVNGFRLHLVESPGMYVIPYSLYFLGEDIESGDDILWDNLNKGLNEQPISVGDISSTIAEKAPSGEYKDVITVEVRPYH